MTAPAMPASPAEGPRECPFCGAEMDQYELSGGGAAWLHPHVTAWCPAGDVQLYSHARLAAWNRRAPARASAADVEAVAAVIDALADDVLRDDDVWVDDYGQIVISKRTSLHELMTKHYLARAALAAIGGAA
jgi:hypothetical protein